MRDCTRTIEMKKPAQRLVISDTSMIFMCYALHVFFFFVFFERWRDPFLFCLCLIMQHILVSAVKYWNQTV